MRITNLTNKNILCFIDETPFVIKKTESIEVEQFNILKISHNCECYFMNEVSKSKILNFLSLLDDPFRLLKKYFIIVDFGVCFSTIKKQICNPQNITIQSNIFCVDIDIKTYYEYFTIDCNGIEILPNFIYVPNKDNIKQGFIKNRKKIIKWYAFWNVLVEPVLLESIGLFMIYRFFSYSIGSYSIFVVLSLVILGGIIDLIFFSRKRKRELKRIDMFFNYLEETVIKNNCYNKHI